MRTGIIYGLVGVLTIAFAIREYVAWRRRQARAAAIRAAAIEAHDELERRAREAEAELARRDAASEAAVRGEAEMDQAIAIVSQGRHPSLRRGTPPPDRPLAQVVPLPVRGRDGDPS